MVLKNIHYEYACFIGKDTEAQSDMLSDLPNSGQSWFQLTTAPKDLNHYL